MAYLRAYVYYFIIILNAHTDAYMIFAMQNTKCIMPLRKRQDDAYIGWPMPILF